MLFPVFFVVVGFIEVAEDLRIQRYFGKYLNCFLIAWVGASYFFK